MADGDEVQMFCLDEYPFSENDELPAVNGMILPFALQHTVCHSVAVFVDSSRWENDREWRDHTIRITSGIGKDNWLKFGKILGFTEGEVNFFASRSSNLDEKFRLVTEAWIQHRHGGLTKPTFERFLYACQVIGIREEVEIGIKRIVVRGNPESFCFCSIL